jgi:hypothetical protein
MLRQRQFRPRNLTNPRHTNPPSLNKVNEVNEVHPPYSQHPT